MTSKQPVQAETEGQAAAGRRARGLVICTGRPIAPKTPLDRVQGTIGLARSRGATGSAEEARA